MDQLNIFGKYLSELCQTNADNLYNKQKIVHNHLMHFQPSINDYYGYNSILDQKGKRVRRMRRTEASLQKLFHSKIKTLPYSRSVSSKRSNVQSLSKNVSPFSLSRFDSNVKLGSAKISLNAAIDTSQNGSRRIKHKDSNQFSQQSSGIKQSQAKDVKLAMGQYYIGKSAQQMQCKKLNSKEPTIKKQSNDLKRSIITSPNLNHLSSNTSRRTLNKTQKSQTVITPFELQENKNKAIIASKTILRKQSNSRLVLSKSNSKLSKISINQNSASQSLISNSEIKSQALSNHARFQQKPSQEQKDYCNQNYQLSSLVKSNKSSLIKKSSQNLPSSISSYSQQPSNLTSNASKIRSKIQKRQKSKISSIDENKSVLVKVNKKTVMIKKQTQTTESNPSQQNSCIQPTPKANKSRVTSIANSQKAKFNPQNGSFLKQSSKISQQQPVKNSSPISLAKVVDSMKVVKKKSIGSYTFNDVVQNIEQHQIRLGSLYLFVDSTKDKYQSSIQYERYERLCFLMIKKYLLEKNRMIRSLKAQQNCFVLTNAEIPTEVLKKHINRQQVRQRLNAFNDESKQVTNELKMQFSKISAKYQKDKYIKLETIRDNFSPQIMRLLMQQLTKLYQQLQEQDIQNSQIDANQQRIIEIIQIMFLLSEISGRPVKQFQLYDENIVDFQQYYTQNYESIMETAQYFQKYA